VSTQIFINLPVADLPKSMAFFKALGFSHDPQFGGENGGCTIVSDTIFVMLCPHAQFREFTPKAICDTSKAVEVLLNLSCVHSTSRILATQRQPPYEQRIVGPRSP
jgi:uncharacterized protein